MQSGVSLREAEPGDASSVLTVKRDAIKALPEDAYVTEQIEAWAPDASDGEAFSAAIDAEQYVVLVAEVGERIVGYGVLTLAEERVDAIYVHPDHSRTGIATALLAQLEMRAQFAGLAELTLVASLNAASFYESVGYERREKTIREINGVEMEWVVMGKTFGE